MRLWCANHLGFFENLVHLLSSQNLFHAPVAGVLLSLLPSLKQKFNWDLYFSGTGGEIPHPIRYFPLIFEAQKFVCA